MEFNRFFPTILFEEPNEDGAGGNEDHLTGSLEDASQEDLVKYVGKLRRENKTYRTQKNEFSTENDSLKEFKTKFETLSSGLKTLFGEEDEVDPEKLKGSITELQSENQRLKTSHAIQIEASKQNLDAELVMAVLSNSGKLDKIDHTKTEEISTLLEELAKAKPALKLTKKVKTGAEELENEDVDVSKLNPIDAYRVKNKIMTVGK
jgi:predicted exporter